MNSKGYDHDLDRKDEIQSDRDLDDVNISHNSTQNALNVSWDRFRVQSMLAGVPAVTSNNLRQHMGLACHINVMLDSPSIAYFRLKELQNICIILATTNSSNTENIRHRIVKYAKYESNYGYKLALYCLGFNFMDINSDFVICNDLCSRLTYFQMFDVIQTYLDWFDIKYQECKDKIINNVDNENENDNNNNDIDEEKEEIQQPIDFGTFMKIFDYQTSNNNRHDNFNIRDGMKAYIDKKQYLDKKHSISFRKFLLFLYLVGYILQIMICVVLTQEYGLDVSWALLGINYVVGLNSGMKTGRWESLDNIQKYATVALAGLLPLNDILKMKVDRTAFAAKFKWNFLANSDFKISLCQQMAAIYFFPQCMFFCNIFIVFLCLVFFFLLWYLCRMV